MNCKFSLHKVIGDKDLLYERLHLLIVIKVLKLFRTFNFKTATSARLIISMANLIFVIQDSRRANSNLLVLFVIWHFTDSIG